MNTSIFLIKNYINECNNDCDQLCKNLFKQGILSKKIEEDNLILIYNKFDDPNMSDLKRECRSLTLDSKTLVMKSYSCNTPIIISDEKEISDLSSKIINKSYEGTYLSVFYHNDKWYVSTRRCLNSDKSVFNISECNLLKSHYKMFEEVLLKACYINFNEFTASLDKTKSYYFVLIHHENKHIIDYTYVFGDNYTVLCLVSIKDENMNELDIYEEKLLFINKYIFRPDKIDSIEGFENNYNTNPLYEGFIIRGFSLTTNKYSIYKLQSDKYKLELAIGKEQNMYKGLIHLYQNNKLIKYFNENPDSKFIKISNSLNTNESYYSIGVIDSTFKVCTLELFELFKIVCSIKTGKSQDKELYDILPKEYKDMIYNIRGIYYKKKSLLFLNPNNNKTSEELRNSHLTISDIYNYLKKLNVDIFVNFLKARKLMCNWIFNKVINKFEHISNMCNKIHIKQCAIFINKLLPDIIFSNLPDTKKV